MRLPVARKCGPCQACCYTTRVHEPAAGIVKDPHVRCGHQGPRGCAIYDARPSGCRAYTCLWLNGGLAADNDRPDVLGIVVELDRKLPTVAMVSEVWPGARKSPRAQGVIASLLAQLRGVVIFVKGETPIDLGVIPSAEEVLSSWARS